MVQADCVQGISSPFSPLTLWNIDLRRRGDRKIAMSARVAQLTPLAKSAARPLSRAQPTHPASYALASTGSTSHWCRAQSNSSLAACHPSAPAARHHRRLCAVTALHNHCPPKQRPQYQPRPTVGKQSEAIIKRLMQYDRRGSMLADFEDAISDLVPLRQKACRCVKSAGQ
jgi:hypothetical protein